MKGNYFCCPFVRVPVNLFVHTDNPFFVCLSIRLFVSPSIRLSVSSSIRLSVSSSIHLSVCRSIRLSVSPFFPTVSPTVHPSVQCVCPLLYHIIYFLHLHEWRKYNTKPPPRMELYNKVFMYTVTIKYTYHISNKHTLKTF